MGKFKLSWVIGLTLFVIAIAVGTIFGTPSAAKYVEPLSRSDSTIKISSPAFQDNGIINAKYTCKGRGIRPVLSISGAPQGTQSLAIIMHDLDAPAGDYSHWLVWDIPADTTSISGTALPKQASQGVNGAGQRSYISPCPPSGTHRYEFAVYALNKKINLPEHTNQRQLQSEMDNHILDHNTLTGLFGTTQ